MSEVKHGGSHQGKPEAEWNFAQQVKRASAEVRQRKKDNPFIFPEYCEMLAAKEQLEAAEQRYRAAVQRWERLGNPESGRADAAAARGIGDRPGANQPIAKKLRVG